MRAYTSLVGHLLGSHPEIDGYYEMHRSYASAADLEDQARRYREQHGLKPGSHYLFDKLLHNDYTLALERLDPDRTVVLMSLRPPEPTLKSIVSLFSRKPGDDPYADPMGAAAYYIERLHALAAFGRRYPRRFCYFDATLIRTDTERILAALGAWLHLGSPLAERYQSFARTGIAGAGDSSPAIASGRVIREENAYPGIVLDADSLRQAQAAYQDCRRQLVEQAAAALTG
ncbi:MAG: hypothetical protein QG662_759 [Pseudomonadota bacterium]|nr:hypothetical protein [Pseudomonadota bacterium]